MKIRFPKETENISGFFIDNTQKSAESPEEEELKFSSSFKLEQRQKAAKFTWKVQGKGSNLSENFGKETIIDIADLFHNFRTNTSESSKNFLEIARYFELILSKKTQISENETFNIKSFEEIYAKFQKTQERRLSELRKREYYGNFLVDFSLTLSLMDISYKTEYFCPDSSIRIDFAVPENKLAFFFYREHERVNVFSSQLWRTPDNFMEIYREILRKAGWNVFFVDFAEWRLTYADKDAKKKYFANILDKIEKKEK